VRRVAGPLFIIVFIFQAILPWPIEAQTAAQRERYGQAFAAAQSKDYEAAYDIAVKLVSADPLYYEGHILRIALATILTKGGNEDPQKLTRVARTLAPIGSNIERDVQNTLAQLAGQPSAPATVTPARALTISPFVRQKLALVVGISIFKDSKINPLGFSANDAQTFSDTLKNACRFDYVKTLINGQATRYQIQTEINNLAKMATAEDLVVIYLATHGSPENLDTAGINYIVTHDTEVENLYPTAYKMDDLLNDIEKRIAAERVVAFIDTCYSGATFKVPPPGWNAKSRTLTNPTMGMSTDALQSRFGQTSRGLKVAPTSGGNSSKAPQGIGRVIIAASRQDERSWESERLQHGYFTFYLIESLKRPGRISIEELFEQISAEVPKAVMQDTKARQTPTMVKNINEPVKIYLKD
jgi:hypothetical protein